MTRSMQSEGHKDYTQYENDLSEVEIEEVKMQLMIIFRMKKHT